jgi:tetratricopeptide (TPR) repeat protein
MMVSNAVKKSRAALRVSAMLAAGVLALTLGAPASAQKVSHELGKPITAAQEAMKKQQWPAALEQIKIAQGIAKTPQENYAIDSLLAYVLYQQKKFPELAPVYERMLASGQTPANEVDDRTKALALMYYNPLRKYAESTKLLKKYLEKRPNDEEANLTLAQIYFQSADYKNAADSASVLIANAEKAGKTPKENWLRIVANSYDKMGNKAGGADALRKLVRAYQQPEDWARMINIVANKSYPDNVSLSLLRLKLDTGTLRNLEDYLEFAQLASDAGAPNESQQIMDRGLKNGALKTTNKVQEGKVQRVMASMQTQATELRSSFSKMTADGSAAADGQALLKVGQVYVGDGKNDQAIDAFQNAIKKGGLTDADEAHVNLGIAYFKKGQKDQARQAFRNVKKDSKWADIAELWTLRAS